MDHEQKRNLMYWTTSRKGCFTYNIHVQRKKKGGRHFCLFMESSLCWKQLEDPYLWTKRLGLLKTRSENPNMIFFSKSQVNHFKMKCKFKEFKGTCLRASAWSTVEQIPERRTGVSRRRRAPCFSILKKTTTKKKPKNPNRNLREITWTGQTAEDQSWGHEGRVLAEHNQEKTFPESFISSPGADGGLFKGTIMVLSKILQKSICIVASIQQGRENCYGNQSPKGALKRLLQPMKPLRWLKLGLKARSHLARVLWKTGDWFTKLFYFWSVFPIYYMFLYFF